MQIHPGLLTAGFAGGSIGTAVGFMRKGEQLENQGASDAKVIAGSIAGGFTHGLVGMGIGAGTAGTVLALKKILGK